MKKEELKKYYVCWDGQFENDDPIFTSDNLNCCIEKAKDIFSTEENNRKWHIGSAGKIDTKKSWIEVREIKVLNDDGIEDYEVVYSNAFYYSI